MGVCIDVPCTAQNAVSLGCLLDSIGSGVTVREALSDSQNAINDDGINAFFDLHLRTKQVSAPILSIS